MSALLDEFPVLSRTKASAMIFRIGVVVVGFLLGLPMVCHGGIFLLELVDYSVGGFPLLIVGMVECIAINWIYGEWARLKIVSSLFRINVGNHKLAALVIISDYMTVSVVYKMEALKISFTLGGMKFFYVFVWENLQAFQDTTIFGLIKVAEKKEMLMY